jgi:hypothetical protein
MVMKHTLRVTKTTYKIQNARDIICKKMP